MLWYELIAKVPPAEVEPVAAVMQEVAPGGLAIDEPIDILGPEMGFRVRGGEPVLVRAWVPASELGAVLVEEMRHALEAFPSVEVTAKPIYEQDWSIAWREFFGVVHTGGRVVVVPSWIEYDARPGEIIVGIDPGQAFGTGHHETTRLCLGALDELMPPGCDVLDVGTGSGVLAIAAIKLGARSVVGYDIDPVAVEVAGRNARENGVEGAITFRKGGVEPGHAGRYGLVIANISAEVNAGLAPIYSEVIAPGGTVILSGILTTRVAAVREAMAREGFVLRSLRVERDWSLLEFARP